MSRDHWRTARAVALAALITAGCSAGGGNSGPQATTQPSFSLPVAGGSTSASAMPSTTTTRIADPVAVATEWLISTRTVNWKDGDPSAWVSRTRPYVTDALAKQYEDTKAGSAGAGWQTFVQRQCVSSVSHAGGVIPPEAPRTDTAVSVQVTGTVNTKCDAGNPDTPKESVAATLSVIKSGGEWLVNQQIY